MAPDLFVAPLAVGVLLDEEVLLELSVDEELVVDGAQEVTVFVEVITDEPVVWWSVLVTVTVLIMVVVEVRAEPVLVLFARGVPFT